MQILILTVLLAAFEITLAGIPESVGVLAFGAGLVFCAVMIRRVLRRGDNVRTEEKVTKEA